MTANMPAARGCTLAARLHMLSHWLQLCCLYSPSGCATFWRTAMCHRPKPRHSHPSGAFPTSTFTCSQSRHTSREGADVEESRVLCLPSCELVAEGSVWCVLFCCRQCVWLHRTLSGWRHGMSPWQWCEDAHHQPLAGPLILHNHNQPHSQSVALVTSLTRSCDMCAAVVPAISTLYACMTGHASASSTLLLAQAGYAMCWVHPLQKNLSGWVMATRP